MKVILKTRRVHKITNVHVLYLCFYSDKNTSVQTWKVNIYTAPRYEILQSLSTNMEG